MNKILINHNWIFEDNGYRSNVTLPHSVKLESLDVFKNYQGKFVYIRNLNDIIANNKNERIFIEFEGVMTNAKVYFNNSLVAEHYGGYLPIFAELTDYVNKENELRVEVENYDDPNTPPGKKTEGLDFLYYGGIYRDVYIYTKPDVYITHPFENYENGGGIKLQTRKLGDTYHLTASISVKNASRLNSKCLVSLEVVDNGKILAKGNNTIIINNNDCKTVTLLIQCENIKEWAVDSPYLYTVNVSVNNYNEEILYGFRTLKVDKNGFDLNSKTIKLFGLNRHEQYPYIGMSGSSNAERREVRMLKQLGVNILRLAHYPQSPAFLDECDKVGLLVIDCVPGWQFKGNKIWRNRMLQCVREMVRRDRNHPCVVIYEVTPNETNWANRRGDLFYCQLNNVAKEELSDCITSGDTVGRRDAEKINFDIPYSGKDKLSPKRTLFSSSGKKFLKREYGDWGFGGNNSTSRVAIGDGEYPMTVQAFNFQWDRNYTYTTENVLGDIVWEGVDHNRGYYSAKPTSKSGVFDVFRRKKFSYYWVKSQSKPNNENYTLFPTITECSGIRNFLVYSNCKSVALILDGKEMIKKNCDNGETHLFDRSGKTAIADNYWALGTDHIAMSEKDCPLARHTKSCLYRGGDCNKLDYPPFTFNDINLDVEKVTFVGYDDNDKKVVEHIMFSYDKAIKLTIDIEDYGIDLKRDSNDFVWLYVKAVDKNGQIDYKYQEVVSLDIEGGNTIFTQSMQAEAGVASFMLKGSSQTIKITAKSQNLSCVQELK